MKLDYKARQSRLENVLTNKAGLPVSIPGLSSDLRLTPSTHNLLSVLMRLYR